MSESHVAEDRLGTDGDAFYELLMKAHENLSDEDSHALNIRLVLIMANQIGDLARLREIITLAKKVEE